MPRHTRFHSHLWLLFASYPIKHISFGVPYFELWRHHFVPRQGLQPRTVAMLADDAAFSVPL